MNYDEFILKLIEGTKSKKIHWEILKNSRNSPFEDYQVFHTQNGDNSLVLRKYDTFADIYEEVITIEANITILNENEKILSEIREDDLNKKENLMRLYRIVERSVNKVDDILASFVDGINIR
ncbi:MAG: hypothetical protein FWC16_06720 [Defluviitaleaceae bacterium]|nr:hypothetical protein [Defluviitaleaceae bacterium]MCL2274604.1 hypothetical protein [Defluviitaleaceae bacterium]